MDEVVEGVVLCQATAEKCVCVKPSGHEQNGDSVHACDPEGCGGEWTGEYREGGDFVAVTLPNSIPMDYIARLLRS